MISLESGLKVGFSITHSAYHALLPALLWAKLNMTQRVYQRISENIYKTLQEHKEASAELVKFNLSRKSQNDLEKVQNIRTKQMHFSQRLY